MTDLLSKLSALTGPDRDTGPWDEIDQFMLEAALSNGATQRDLRDWFPNRSPYAISLAVQLHDRKLKAKAKDLT